LDIETPSLRVPQKKEISWVVRASQPGQYAFNIRNAGSAAQKTIVVAHGGWDRVTPRVVTSGFWNQFTHPGEASLPQNSQIEWVDVSYPDRLLTLFGLKAHWLVHFFVLTCLLGFVGSKLMRVTV
jgi:hypothetical protein